jgi:hypothetical protein
MGERVETQSENAHHVILKYKEKLYYVSKIRFYFSKDEEMHRALLHSKGLRDGQLENLEFKVSRKLFELLTEYAKMNNPDLLLVLFIEGKELKWQLLSESCLKQQLNQKKAYRYIV